MMNKQHYWTKVYINYLNETRGFFKDKYYKYFFLRPLKNNCDIPVGRNYNNTPYVITPRPLMVHNNYIELFDNLSFLYKKLGEAERFIKGE